jgi:hypothetical protein
VDVSVGNLVHREELVDPVAVDVADGAEHRSEVGSRAGPSMRWEASWPPA